jgi:hypothetical protein
MFAAQGALAGMVTDPQGNVGYDTAAECDAAVTAGTAKFYKPFTKKAASLRKGEDRFQVMTLKDVAISQDEMKSLNFQAGDYKRGACDLGQSTKAGQNGVSKQLVGKYVPYSADMPVNVYFNKQGLPVRMSMMQCDNRFSANLPRLQILPKKCSHLNILHRCTEIPKEGIRRRCVELAQLGGNYLHPSLSSIPRKL